MTRGPDETSIDRWDDLRNTQLELHRSFALALGGLWERHFRHHLVYSAAVLCKQYTSEKVQRADWEGMGEIFKATRGFTLAAFPSYAQLQLLYLVTSAVRHGNGSSTETLFKSHPELFGHEPVVDYFSYFTLGGEPQHSIYRLDITYGQLVQFKDAVVDFWLMIRALQASSSD